MNLITLQNGLRIFTYPQPELRSATVGVWVASGSRYENEKSSGISHFIEHIVFKGSEKRNAFEIAQAMDEIGAAVNAYTTKEYTFFYVRALDYQIENAADIFFDMLKNPKLDEDDIETEKGVILEEISMCEDDPADVCCEVSESAVFSGCGLCREILGTRGSVSAFQREDFVAHLEKFYVPERTVIGVSGNFDEEKILDIIKRFYGDDKNTGNPLCETEVPFHTGFTVRKREFEQTHIILAFNGIGIRHEDLYPLQLCLFILGTGSSSRLNQRIREQLGLVYSIDAYLSRYLGGGCIAVQMSLSPQSEKTAIEETVRIIKALSGTLTEKELKCAKEKLTASLIMSREQPQSKLSSFGYTQLMLSAFIDDDEIIESIKNVTLADVKKAAERYLDLKKISFTAVGKTKDEEFYRKVIENAVKN